MEPGTKPIVHLCLPGQWEAAQAAGEYRSSSLEEVGFIHCSRPEQILGVANSYFQGAKDLTLLWIDPQRVESEIRWEISDGQVFPHIYGSINLAAVLAVSELSPDADGIFQMVPATNCQDTPQN
jgi:uncharacterized protein (DUF952 family)